MLHEELRDFIPWSDYYETRDKSNEVESIKEIFKRIRRTIALNKRTLREYKPKEKKKDE